MNIERYTGEIPAGWVLYYLDRRAELPTARIAVVMSSAERWAELPGGGWQPMPYRAPAGRRRVGVAVYLGAGLWEALVVATTELQFVRRAKLGADPTWGPALTRNDEQIREGAALAGLRRTMLLEWVQRGLALARKTWQPGSARPRGRRSHAGYVSINT